VFREDEGDTYAALMGERYAASKNKTRTYKDWRTYQMSDHLLLWVELKIGYAREYLHELKGEAVPPAPGSEASAPGRAGRDAPPRTIRQSSSRKRRKRPAVEPV
jgi:hypothetical protein